jgi:membrane-associated phospholipid phosphatase
MSLRQKLLALDAQYSNQINISSQPGLLRNLARFLAHSGDSWFWLLGLLIVWLIGIPVWKHLAGIMAIGILITAVTVFLIKFIVRRQRPEGEWGNVYRRTDPHSFPSGHAARAMMLAVIALGMGPTWLGLLLILWAPLVILSRVAMQVHYWSDVLAGGLLGLCIGLLVLRVTL